MATASVLVNQSILKRFELLLSKDKLAHAYLFVGPQGSGKIDTALACAKLINCEKNASVEKLDACLCPSCAKINSGNHPDIFITRCSFGESIKIEQVRALIERTTLRSFFAKRKVFIIENVDNLTPESANALLKTLEEPSKDSLLILTTAVLDNVLDTIKSRCHVAVFVPLANEDLAAKLVEHYDVKGSEAQFLAYFSEGCLGRAKQLHEDKFIDSRNQIIKQFILAEPAEAFLKDIQSDKEKTKRVIDVALCWVRDALMLKAGQAVTLTDFQKELSSFNRNFAVSDLLEIFQELVKTNQLLADNLNIKLPLYIIKERLRWVSS